MNIFQYIKDEKRTILCFFIGLLAAALVLFIAKTPLWAILTACGCILIAGITAFFMGFAKKRSFYKDFLHKVNTLDRPYDICKSMDRPDFFEGGALLDTLDFCLGALKKDTDISVPEYVFLRKELFAVMRNYNRDFSERKISCALKNLECSVYADMALFHTMAEAVFSYAARYAPEEKPYLKWYGVHNEMGVLLYAETNALPAGEQIPWQLALIEKLCHAQRIRLNTDFSGRTLLEFEFLKPTLREQ